MALYNKYPTGMANGGFTVPNGSPRIRTNATNGLDNNPNVPPPSHVNNVSGANPAMVAFFNRFGRPTNTGGNYAADANTPSTYVPMHGAIPSGIQTTPFQGSNPYVGDFNQLMSISPALAYGLLGRMPGGNNILNAVMNSGQTNNTAFRSGDAYYGGGNGMGAVNKLIQSNSPVYQQFMTALNGMLPGMNGNYAAPNTAPQSNANTTGNGGGTYTNYQSNPQTFNGGYTGYGNTSISAGSNANSSGTMANVGNTISAYNSTNPANQVSTTTGGNNFGNGNAGVGGGTTGYNTGATVGPPPARTTSTSVYTPTSGSTTAPGTPPPVTTGGNPGGINIPPPSGNNAPVTYRANPYFARS